MLLWLIKNVIIYWPVCVWESPGRSVHSAACGSASVLSPVAVRDKKTANIRRREHMRSEWSTNSKAPWPRHECFSVQQHLWCLKQRSILLYKNHCSHGLNLKLKYSKLEERFKFCVVVIKAFGQTFTRSDHKMTQKCINKPARMSAGESMIMNDTWSQWFPRSSVTILIFSYAYNQLLLAPYETPFASYILS